MESQLMQEYKKRKMLRVAKRSESDVESGKVTGSLEPSRLDGETLPRVSHSTTVSATVVRQDGSKEPVTQLINVLRKMEYVKYWEFREGNGILADYIKNDTEDKVPFSLSDFLLSIGYIKGFDFTEEVFTKIDYDPETDEWTVSFKRKSSNEFSVYNEFMFNVGHILGAKWDKDINGFRFPAISYQMREIISYFENEKKEYDAYMKRHNLTVSQFYNGEKYKYVSAIEISEVAKQITTVKRNLEERWIALQSASDGASPTSEYCPAFPLMQHQHNGIEFALSHERCIIADEMRTGKTRQALDVAMYRFNQKQISRTIAIVPNSIKGVWKTQIAKFYKDKMIPITVSGSESFEKRLEKLRVVLSQNRMPFYIIGFETARSHPVELQKILDDGLLIMDECHKIKGHNSQITKVVMKLHPSYALLLTGTPIINVPEDAYTIFNFVRPGIVGRSFDEYMRFFCSFDKKTRRVQYRNLETFNGIVKPFYIRRLQKDVLELPERVYVQDYEDIELTLAQKKVYHEMAALFRAQLENMKGETYQTNATTVVTQILRLLQICDGYIQDKSPICEWISENAKLDILKELLKEYLLNGKKAVIWSRFIPPLSMLSQELIEYRPVALHGGVKEQLRGVGPDDGPETIVGKFWKDDSCKILLGQLHTGGLGIDLSCADTCIFFDQWWSPGINQQAEDRLMIHKKKNKVTIIPLVTAPTIEQMYFAHEYEGDDGNLHKGVMYQKKDWITQAIEGVNNIVPSREDLIKWLEKI